VDFLNLFSLTDVAIVFTGLVIVSIIRIYYDSYVNKQKAKRFGSSLGIYNSLLDDTREGLFILADDKVIFSNIEAADILHVKQHQIDKAYLSTLQVKDDYSSTRNDLFNIIQTKEYIPNATILNDTDNISVSISVNKVKPYSHTDTVWYIVILQNMTHVHALREGAESLLAA